MTILPETLSTQELKDSIATIERDILYHRNNNNVDTVRVLVVKFLIYYTEYLNRK